MIGSKELSNLYFSLNLFRIFFDISLNLNSAAFFNHKFAPYDKKLSDFSSLRLRLLASIKLDIFSLEPKYSKQPNNSTLEISNSLKIILAGRVKGGSFVFE